MRVSSNAKIAAEDQLTVYSLLTDAAARAPQATAITFLPSMESEPIRLTYGAFIARLHRIARLFRGLGVARIAPPQRRHRRSLNSAALPTIRHPRLPSTQWYQLFAVLKS
jgi:acyl-CoA synthetase (AMP-forming)/AMP-acid ligase II